jgi:hypothetical protein
MMAIRALIGITINLKNLPINFQISHANFVLVLITKNESPFILLALRAAQSPEATTTQPKATPIAP